jgi:hypothetical protein
MNPTLWELLDIPLLVDIITRAYQNQPAENLKVPGGLHEQRNHLITAYVNRMFQHRGANGRYSPERTLHCFSITRLSVFFFTRSAAHTDFATHYCRNLLLH